MGLPNSGSADVGWPWLDADADPTLEDAVGAWRERSDRLRDYLIDIEPVALTVVVEVLESGVHAVHDCIGVVLVATCSTRNARRAESIGEVQRTAPSPGLGPGWKLQDGLGTVADVW